MSSRYALRRNISDRICIALLSVIVWLIVSAFSPTMSRAAEPSARPTTAVTEERLLQQFISSALNPKQAPASLAESSRPDTVTASPEHRAVEQPELPSNPLPADYSRATLNMVLALGATLGILALGGYVCRRYLLKSPWLGKRGSTLRVIARVNLTPKAAVALVEVPGKLLVVGVTGNCVTGLSELPVTPQHTDEGQPHPSTVSFAETLERQSPHSNGLTPATQTLERQSPHSHGHTPTEDPLLGLSERIQRKVSSLKRL